MRAQSRARLSERLISCRRQASGAEPQLRGVRHAQPDDSQRALGTIFLDDRLSRDCPFQLLAVVDHRSGQMCAAQNRFSADQPDDVVGALSWATAEQPMKAFTCRRRQHRVHRAIARPVDPGMV